MEDYHYILQWLWIAGAFAFGSIIGSFLNVCIYRLPPRVYFFDDVFYPATTGDLLSDIKDLWDTTFGTFFHKKKEAELALLEPFLYAETLWSLPIVPESAVTMGIVHNFNLFKEFFHEPLSVNKPDRSFCPRCKKQISWWMNIPVFSWIFLGARCYYCKETIPIRYPVNEMLSGVLCAGLFHIHGVDNFPVFIYYYVLCALCIVVFFIDLDNWLILDETTIPFTLAGFAGSLFVPAVFFLPAPGMAELFLFSGKTPALFQWFINMDQATPAWLHPQSLLYSLMGAFLGFAGFYSIAVIGTLLAKREAMGGGDIKFAMLMGAFLGPQKALLAFFLSVLLGTFIMVPGMLLGRKTSKDQVPFGCFLTIATVAVIFFGDKLIQLYFSWPILINGGF